MRDDVTMYRRLSLAEHRHRIIPARVHWLRADSRFVPSQWETSLQSKAVSHWLCANLRVSRVTVVISYQVHCEKEGHLSEMPKNHPNCGITYAPGQRSPRQKKGFYSRQLFNQQQGDKQNMQGNTQDLYSLSGWTSYRKILLSLEAARLGLDISNHSGIWQALWQQHCQDGSQILERYKHYSIQSRGFKTLWYLAVRRLAAYWTEAQD